MDTTRNTVVLPADEAVEAAAAAAVEQEASANDEVTPYTLDEAHEIRGYEENLWDKSIAPSKAQWDGMRRRLARADRASVALIGLTELLNDHRFAKDLADAQGVACHSFNDFQEGCVADAQQLLIWLVHEAIDDIKKTTCREGE